jgi:hypothetical protein
MIFPIVAPIETRDHDGNKLQFALYQEAFM